MLVKDWRKIFAYPENEGGAAAEETETEETDAEGAETEEPEDTEAEDDAADDADADDAADDGTGAAASQSRKETRQQRLANEARTEREARIRLEGELAAIRNQPAKPVDDGEAKRIREEKLSLMDAGEKRIFLQDEQIAELRRGQQLTQLQIQDSADRSAFATKAATDPVYKKHYAAVEEALGKMRAAGNNAPRETILAFIIGNAALKGAKPDVKKKNAAAVRVKTAAGAPTSARADAPGKKSGGNETAAEMEARILAREQRGDM